MVFRQQTAHDSDPLEKGGRGVWKPRCEPHECFNLLPREEFSGHSAGGETQRMFCVLAELKKQSSEFEEGLEFVGKIPEGGGSCTERKLKRSVESS